MDVPGDPRLESWESFEQWAHALLDRCHYRGRVIHSTIDSGRATGRRELTVRMATEAQAQSVVRRVNGVKVQDHLVSARIVDDTIWGPGEPAPAPDPRKRPPPPPPPPFGKAPPGGPPRGGNPPEVRKGGKRHRPIPKAAAGMVR